MIQQKVDAYDTFNHSWAEYKVGFNDSRGNYWLGNDLLSQLTMTQRSYTLMIELQYSRYGLGMYQYSSFVVLPESSNYRLEVSGYSGTTRDDGLSPHTGMMFTTFDRDNDQWSSGNCAAYYGGGFWYSGCGSTFPNGNSDNFLWATYTLASIRMFLRCP